MKFQKQQLLKTGWLFALTEDKDATESAYNDHDFHEVSIPHDWQIEGKRDPDMPKGNMQGYFPRNQTGVYRLRWQVPKVWAGKTIRLVFDGCQRFYEVWLNGQKVGEKRYGYVPYTCEVTNSLLMGETNILCVRVNHPETMGDRWYSGAGLYRDVRVLIDEPLHFAPWGITCRTNIHDNQAKVDITLNVVNRLSCDKLAHLNVQMTAPDGQTSISVQTEKWLPVGESDWHIEMPVDHILRWDIDSPALYRLLFTLSDDVRIMDIVEEKIGFRTIAFDGERGFFLNEKVRKLHGANLHHDGGLCFGAAVPQGVLRRRLEKLRDLGCNAIRCSHNPHAEELYDLCDEMGFLVIDELYDKWCGSELYFNQLFEIDRMDDLQAMIHRDRNHPCVVLWSMGNEVEIQYSDRYFHHLQEMCEACRILDPTRPVSMALIGFCICIPDYDDQAPLTLKLEVALRYSQIVDVFMGNYMEGYYQVLRNAGMCKAIIGSEVFSYYRYADLTTTNVITRSSWRDIDEKPYVVGGFVWAGVDYLGEAAGYPNLGWTGCPIDSAGFLKLRAWHLQSIWRKEPLVKIGVYDEGDPWDMACASWSFPQMSRHWNFSQNGRMMHIAVMSNCEEVHLYLNDDPARVMLTDTPDRMAHFNIPFTPGRLRAEGVIQGAVVANDELRTAFGAKQLRLTCSDIAGTPGHDVAHVEVELMDDQGQLCTWESPEVHFDVTDGATFVAVDNGNFVGERDTRQPSCRFNLGHALVYIRANHSAKVGTIRATCGDMQASLELSVQPS